ncbi:MAG: hypothetical protein C0619_07570 [Desulfuromonas sp.]|nr:MAG: hypothetical protein C0619_07570 [Desulfuromonas sp.]
MSINTILIALTWGAAAGYLILRTLDSLLAVSFCLHGILLRRWKHLVNPASPGQINYSIILRMLLRVTLHLVLFGFLLETGTQFIRREYQFAYQGTEFVLWGIAALVPSGFLLRKSLRRLIVVWKVTHQFDYAEKRKRTLMLRK